MKFVFFGTPQLAADILDHLKQHNLVPSLVVTNPDRPQGRHMTLTPPPVKIWAEKHRVPVVQPESPSDPDFLYTLKAGSFELFIVVAYGAILPQELLNIPKHGALNVHYSLLPKYRGATPVESQILADDRDVGVSLMLIDEKMDHGPIVAQKALQFPNSKLQTPNKSQITNSKSQTPARIDWPPKARELRAALNALAGEMLVRTLPQWVQGKIAPKPQDHSKATYTKKFTKTDGEIDLKGDPYRNFLKICAFEDSIGTYFFAPSSSPPRLRRGAEGGVVGVQRRIRVVIRGAEYRDGKLHILRVIPEGRKEMNYEEFLRGLK